MREKIKVNVSYSLGELMYKDAVDFCITRSDGSANMNAFINLLVMNYYEAFAQGEEELREKIISNLSDIPKKKADEVLSGIIKAIAEREKDEDGREKSVSLSFKPTRLSEGVFIHIENVLIKNEAISSFYRRMFISYSKKTKNEREKIIHKGVYDLLCRAMDKQVAVCISLDSGQVFGDAAVYAVASAKDELFNYALLYSGKKNRTVRLAKIKTVTLLPVGTEIPQVQAEMFNRQILCGAQYPIYNTDDEPIKVQLSEKGKALFNKIYLYRPIPASVDGDVYTFECSANQVLYYFERFGSEALILSPKKLGIFMRNYYYFALKKYRSIYGKD